MCRAQYHKDHQEEFSIKLRLLKLRLAPESLVKDLS